MVVLVGVAAVSSCTTWFWGQLNRGFTSDPPVPLTQGLPTLIREIDPAFNRRIQATFPIGSSDKAMGSVLGRQGFTRGDWTTQLDEEHRASREEHRLPCVTDYQVFWRSDPQGHLLSIRGQAFVSCL